MISVIIPIYNAEKFLRECLDSIVRQTYSDLEIILVNDGSTDSSLDICREYAAKDGRILVVSQENKGQMAAWITGVGLSKGQYIGFVDSDDYIEDEMYEKMLAQTEKYDTDIVMCGRRTFDTKSAVIGDLGMKEYYSEEEISEIHALVFPSLHNCISQARWDKLFKRELLIPNMERYCRRTVRTMEDRFIVSSCLLHARTFSVVNEPLYNWRVTKNSSSKKARRELSEIVELLYTTQEQMLRDLGLLEKYRKRLELTRLDYMRMIIIRNLSRKNDLTLLEKKQMAEEILRNKENRRVVIENKDECIGKFGAYIYACFSRDSADLMVFGALLYGAAVQRENRNGF